MPSCVNVIRGGHRDGEAQVGSVVIMDGDDIAGVFTTSDALTVLAQLLA
jgi:hypothetical protein